MGIKYNIPYAAILQLQIKSLSFIYVRQKIKLYHMRLKIYHMRLKSQYILYGNQIQYIPYAAILQFQIKSLRGRATKKFMSVGLFKLSSNGPALWANISYETQNTVYHMRLKIQYI